MSTLLVDAATDIGVMYDADFGFAETCTGPAGSFLGIFDYEYVDADAGGFVQVTAREPILRVRDADVVAKGGEIAARGTYWTVVEVMPDGGGETLLRLINEVARSYTLAVDADDRSYVTTYTVWNDTYQCGDIASVPGADPAITHFTGVDIPQGAIIVSALQKVNITTNGGAVGNIDCRVQSIDDAPALTSNPVAWVKAGDEVVNWNGSGTGVVIADMTNGLQVVINRPGWASGNAINTILWPVAPALGNKIVFESLTATLTVKYA
jgi:hypothetical protein